MHIDWKELNKHLTIPSVLKILAQLEINPKNHQQEYPRLKVRRTVYLHDNPHETRPTEEPTDDFLTMLERIFPCSMVSRGNIPHSIVLSPSPKTDQCSVPEQGNSTQLVT